jgi:two-component system, OmpR family, copper resistance phosphate regulon response regulator CusR
MHTIILARNVQQANFIKKGLYYENLGCDVVSFNDGDVTQDDILNADGVFVLLDDATEAGQCANFCREIKPGVPVIALAQRYDGGFNGLLNERRINFIFTRPFPFRHMSAEMRYAIFQRKEDTEMQQYILRDLHLDISRHQVKFRDKSLSLRNKEFSLLHYLMINRGKVLTRMNILENVWDRNINMMTNTVDVHISQLRKKIGDGDDSAYIHTVPCTGYIFE